MPAALAEMAPVTDHGSSQEETPEGPEASAASGSLQLVTLVEPGPVTCSSHCCRGDDGWGAGQGCLWCGGLLAGIAEGLIGDVGEVEQHGEVGAGTGAAGGGDAVAGGRPGRRGYGRRCCSRGVVPLGAAPHAARVDVVIVIVASTEW